MVDDKDLGTFPKLGMYPDTHFSSSRSTRSCLMSYIPLLCSSDPVCFFPRVTLSCMGASVHCMSKSLQVPASYFDFKANSWTIVWHNKQNLTPKTVTTSLLSFSGIRYIVIEESNIYAMSLSHFNEEATLFIVSYLFLFYVMFSHLKPLSLIFSTSSKVDLKYR